MAEKSIQDQVKLLQNYVGGFAKLLKELQNRIKNLEEKSINPKADGLSEIIEQKKVIDESILVNSDAVKRLDKEIKTILKDKNKKDNHTKVVDDAINRLDNEIVQIKVAGKKSVSDQVKDASNSSDKTKKEKRCRYYNHGFCKYREKCRFIHPKEVCQVYIEGKCEEQSCQNRHPRACKWFQGESGCRRSEDCDYSHDKLVCGNKKVKSYQNYKCAGCKHEWQEKCFVVQHNLKNMEVFFCLNCDEWIKDKDKVFDFGWSLFDQDGNLNYFV